MKNSYSPLAKQQGGIKAMAIIFLMIGFWVWFFKLAPLNQYTATIKNISTQWLSGIDTKNAEQALEKITEKLPSSKVACDIHPPKHGRKFLLRTERASLKLHSRFFIFNEHVFPVLITLLNKNTSEDFGTIFMMPNQSSKINLPVNSYTLKVQSGKDWCNFNQGFSDAAYIQSAQTVHIKANSVANLRLISFGNSPSELMMSFSNSLGMIANSSQGIQGSGTLILQRVIGGHYAIEGAINGLPVNFLVDTGATSVAISTNFAKHAGITACKKSKSRTANGIIDTCIATASELTIGQFTLRNVTVNYSKGLGDNVFLLGMNVIGLFKMEQQGDVMKLSL